MEVERAEWPVCVRGSYASGVIILNAVLRVFPGLDQEDIKRRNLVCREGRAPERAMREHCGHRM
eukprot:scaffold297965_cov17-Tisochrysis_lutea.AAC.1